MFDKAVHQRASDQPADCDRRHRLDDATDPAAARAHVILGQRTHASRTSGHLESLSTECLSRSDVMVAGSRRWTKTDIALETLDSTKTKQLRRSGSVDRHVTQHNFTSTVFTH